MWSPRSGLVIAILVLGHIAPVAADGIVLLHEERRGAAPSQSAQQALIVWDNGVETLHLQSNYSGPPEGFSWIVPLPAGPKVERSSWQLFTQAETVSRPRVLKFVGTSHGFPCGCSASMGTKDSVSLAPSVVTLESLDVEEFRVNVVSAADGGGFIRWLRATGHAVPDGAKQVLQKYIDKEFFFVVVKIREDSVAKLAKGKDGNIATGLTPLALIFKTKRPFYPLEISSASSAPENELLLLTLSSTPLIPDQYQISRLTYQDVENGVGDDVRKSKSGDRIDLSPAVRLAQARRPGPRLVLEAVVPVKWRNPAAGEAGTLVEAFPAPSDEVPLYVTRFHGFLGPSEMLDITFTQGGDDFVWEPYYIVDAGAGAAPVPIGFACFGLGMVVVSLRCRRGLRLRKLAFLPLALAACVG